MPIHVPVKNADGSSKFEINPVKLIENNGMKNKDIHLAQSIIEENEELIEQKWKDYFYK